jgi:anti-sigma factor RsiW
MTCPEAPLLSGWVDRELDAATSLHVERHVATCKRCSAAVERLDALRSALAAAPLAHPAPPDLAARIRAQVEREAPPGRAPARRGSGRRLGIAAGAALAAMLAWVVVARVVAPGGEDPLVAELVASHVRSLMVDHLVDVPSSDRHTVRPWFNGKIDFAPPVADYAANGFPLVGGRLDYVAGRPVAALVYRHQPHLVNLVVWPADPDTDAPEERSAQGYSMLRWRAGGLQYWAVSDIGMADLHALADLIVASQAHAASDRE